MRLLRALLIARAARVLPPLYWPSVAVVVVRVLVLG